jgi:dihydroorotate dehydrogenase
MPVTVMGLDFPTRWAGGRPGQERRGHRRLCATGFRFVEIGTVTPRPQPGNPKPRIFRLPEAEAIINRMGFNNLGVDHLLARVQAAKYKGCWASTSARTSIPRSSAPSMTT